ncbi:hypothetical protein M9458_014778, partial [Cirrhinus mrigala]
FSAAAQGVTLSLFVPSPSLLGGHSATTRVRTLPPSCLESKFILARGGRGLCLRNLRMKRS